MPPTHHYTRRQISREINFHNELKISVEKIKKPRFPCSNHIKMKKNKENPCPF